MNDAPIFELSAGVFELKASEPAGYLSELRKAVHIMSEAIYALSDKIQPFLSLSGEPKDSLSDISIPKNYGSCKTDIIELTYTISSIAEFIKNTTVRVELP